MSSHPSTTDADDVLLVLDGDRDAYGRLYDRHASRVRAVTAAVSGDWRAVEDLTQETFLRGYAKLRRLKRRNDFGPWIGGIARLVARERRRSISRDRHRFVSSTDELPDGIDGVLLGKALEDAEEVSRLLQAIKALPERERVAIHAYYFEELNGNRASEMLGLSRSGFYAALGRGLKKLGATPVEKD